MGGGLEAESGRPATVSLGGGVHVSYLQDDLDAGYALLQWDAPAGAPSPPLHVHRQTDEGFYVLSGTFRFLVEGKTIDGPPGTHLTVPKHALHTFWNAGQKSARCLIILTPPDFAPYFRDLAQGLQESQSDDDATRVRRELSAKYDIELVRPPMS
jgi:mannose-6-phosphate isomerase-like protein (cupin superfamily)